MRFDWRSRWREVFAIDLRTLALFRAALGATLAVDMANRFVNLRAFYTDWGVMPRDWVLDWNGPLRLSLHLINGDAWFAALLLGLELVGAVALAAGYRTRLACFVVFVLEGSLLNRNPIVLLGGDTLLVCLLFWGMFLPLHARWSIDAALSETPPPEDHRHLSAASAGLIVQVLAVYFFSAILKRDPEWWPDGTAVYYTMSLDRYTTPIGRYLLNFPGLMQGLSYFVYFLELLGPIVALSPFLQRPLRFAVMLALMCMHTGFIVCMQIGLFPFVSLTSLTALLGGWWWDWARRRADHGRWLKIYYDGDCEFCLKSCLLLRHLLVLPHTEIAPAQGSVRASALMQAQYSWVVIDADDVAHTKWNAFVAILRQSLLFRWLAPLASLRLWEKPGVAVYDWVGRHRGGFGAVTATLFPKRSVRFELPRRLQWLAGAALVAIIAWNLVTIGVLPATVARVLQPVMLPLRIDQSWPMFAPHPWQDDGWYVIPGTLEDGSEIDVWTRKPIDWTKPSDVAKTEPDVRWRTYHTMLWERSMAAHREFYARWMCRDWNVSAEPGKHLLSLKIVYMLEHTPPPGTEPTVEQRILWRQECVGKTPAEVTPPELEKKAPSDAEMKRPV